MEEDVLDIFGDALSSDNDNELPEHIGSYPRGRPNPKRNREQGAQLFFQDYFSESPKYDGSIFQRRFCVTKQRFMKRFNVLQADLFSVSGLDCTCKMDLSGIRKATAALRVLTYGRASDAIDGYLANGLFAQWKFACAILQNFCCITLRKYTYAVEQHRIWFYCCRNLLPNGFPVN